MKNKIDSAAFDRIRQLKAIGLTDKVISIRLGVSERTIRIYTRALREGINPFQPPSSDPAVPEPVS